MGPVMICVTKEEGTYLSFIHCLLREVPGLSQYLHATGTDSELALRNATAAGMQNASALLRYLHSQRSIKAKLKELGISQSLNSKICCGIYAKGSSLLWSDSKSNSMSEWRSCWKHGMHLRVKKEEVPHNLPAIFGNSS